MILSAGLSPAWQQILLLDELRLGQVNRAAQAEWCAAGKVINVALAAAHLGQPTSLVSAIGGATGDEIQREIERWGLPSDWIHTSSPTRVCTTLVIPGQPATELVENVQEMELEVLADFVDRTRTYAAHADVTVLSGSLPEGAPADLLARVLDGIAGRFILDFRGESLRACLPHHPLVVKPNRAELAVTMGRPLESDDELLSAMRELVEAGAQWVVISDGPRDIWVHSQQLTARFTPPPVEVINPIGSGDCMAAGIAVGLLEQGNVLEAIRLGIGAACHNTERLLPARLDRARCEELAGQVKWERVSG